VAKTETWKEIVGIIVLRAVYVSSVRAVGDVRGVYVSSVRGVRGVTMCQCPNDCSIATSAGREKSVFSNQQPVALRTFRDIFLINI
jgi:hypothetical protein